jgi:hypothetical protein
MLARRERCKETANNGNGFGLTTAMSVALWQTPGTDSFRSRGGDRKDEMGLDQQARFWATPTVQDGKNTAGPSQFGRNSHPLNVEAVLWPTPRSSPAENRTTKMTPSQIEGRRGQYLSVVASTHQPDTTAPDGQPSRRVLNPRFAETLMGWPPGWTQPCLPIEMTAFAQWETASCRLLRRLRGSS